MSRRWGECDTRLLGRCCLGEGDISMSAPSPTSPRHELTLQQHNISFADASSPVSRTVIPQFYITAGWLTCALTSWTWSRHSPACSPPCSPSTSSTATSSLGPLLKLHRRLCRHHAAHHANSTALIGLRETPPSARSFNSRALPNNACQGSELAQRDCPTG